MYQNRPSLKLSLKLSAIALVAVGSFVVFGFFHPLNGQAAAGINQQLNFQGRLLDNTGAVVPDGTYNMEFKIYQDGAGCVAGGTSPCGGTLKWTEDWIQTNRVTVKNGFFSANLGSINAFASQVDWNQNTLWLSTNIGGVTNTPTPSWDGEMTPFKRMASSPYALNSNALQGLQAASFVQLAQGIQADSSTTNPSIFINKTGTTANIVELQKSNVDVFTITNNGDVTATGKYNTDTISSMAITFGAASTANIDAASGQILQIGASSASVTLGANTTVASGKSFTANGTALFENSANSPTAFQIQSATAADTLLTADTSANKVVIGDATGTNTNTTQLIVDSSTVDPTSGYNGAIYYNSTNDKFRCYQASAWADCLAASGNGSATYTGSILNVAGTATAAAVQAETFTAATTFTVASTVTSFKAPAAGSFRACQMIGDATTTGGNASLRWRVNGVSVGAAACTISLANFRTSTTALDDGVVTFAAGDLIGVVVDSIALAPAATTDFTVFWSVEYNSVNTAPSGATLQSAYNNNSNLTTTDNNDLLFNAADTATDSNILFNLQCVTTCSTDGRFAVQNAGVDVFTINPNSGNIALAPAGAGSTVVSTDGDSNFQVNYTGTTDATLDIAHINILDNASANTGSLYGLAIVNNDNGANVGVPDALGYLKNANAAETLPDGLLVEQTGAGTLTSGLEVKQTAGTVVNGLTLTGTFTKLINSTNFNVTGAGAGTFASTLTVNGTTFSLGNGSASIINTPSGNAGLSITPNGSGDLSLATTNTGDVVVGNSTGTFSLTSNGGLNVTTGGALTGVASLDTINTSATALTFAGAGTVSSGTGSDVALSNQIALRPGVDASNGLTIQNSSATATIASFGTNTSNNNLIANSSLEANANSWLKKGNVAVNVSSNDDFAQYGSRSLKIVTTATAADGASYSVPLKASTQYTLSAWIRLSTGTATTINLNRQDNGADVDTGAGNCTAISVNTVFTQYTCTFTTGATVNGTTNVYVKQTDAPVGGRTIYVDGVTLVASASGLTYDAGGSSLNVQTSNNTLTLNGTDSGDVQPWQLSPSPLTTALRYGDGVQANGFAYYVGGCTGACGAGTAVATVYYAKMNADGSMGAWSAATSMPANRYGLVTYASNGYLYAVGGDSGTGVFGAAPQSTVYYTKLNSDGTVGTWQTSVNALPAAREFPASTNMNGFAYVIGGDNAGAQSTSYYAKMYADGSTSPWTTTTALTTGATARRYATTVTANGYIYVIGGDTGGTAQSTVYYNSINGNGTLGATWASTTALSVGGAQPRRYLTSVVVNGYVYAIGGDNGTAAQSTVYYSHLLPDGTIGAWQAATNPLPAGRYGADSVLVNGYIYEIGGYNGTAAQATPYYASTARILIGGSLDLVGLGGGTISASAGAGAITAGNIRAVGGLTVDGAGDFNNGLSVDSIINLNAISANAGQTVFNINNLNSNSIFSVRHMNTNFGALATTGAFMSKNSYFGEEYNVGHNAACTSTTTVGSRVQAYARGDGGNGGSSIACSSAAAGANVGAGELNFSNVIGAATSSCSAASPGASTANGVEQITAVGTVTAGGKALCAENIAASVTTSSKIYTSTNLPVVEVKVKPTTTAASNNTVVVVGMGAEDAVATTDVLPQTGIFFTNCSNYSATAPTGCSNTTWYGMASGGSAQVGATQTCSTAMTANFAYLRIEVRATNDVHFFADSNTTDGISETECGSGITSTVNAGAMSMWVAANSPTTATAATTTLQIDYFRSWQDDNVGLSDDVVDASATTPEGDQASASTLPLTPVNAEMDGIGSDDDANPFSTLADFVAATSEDTTFNNNIYVKGTIFANKIVANQIEGMDVITDQIKNLTDEVAKQQAASPATTKTGLSGAGSGKVSFTTVSIANLTVMAQFEAKGGLVVDGDAQFNGKTLFQLAAEFNGPATFNGQVTYNSDAGGTAIIHDGDQKVSVKFSKAYTGKPIIVANWSLDDTKDAQGNVDSSDAKQQRLLDSGYSYSVANVTTKGFDIILNKKAGEDVELSWIANAIKNPQISQSSSGSSN